VKIIESAALSEIIMLMKDGYSDVRQVAIDTISSLAGHGMNLLQAAITD
jgi:hypothetical protein